MKIFTPVDSPYRVVDKVYSAKNIFWIATLFQKKYRKITLTLRLYGRGATFKHTKKSSQHISKTLQHFSILNTFLIKNARKYLYNTFKKKFRFVCFKVKFSTFNPILSLNNIKK
jgi:hypothetical protein